MRKQTRHVSRGKKKRYKVDPGASPGTLAIEPGGPKAEVRCFGFGPDSFEERALEDVKDLAAFNAAWPVVWVHMSGIKDLSALTEVQRAFGLHSLAMEDVINQNQRPKMEAYDGHGYMVLFSAERKESMNTSQVNLFMGERFVVSIVEGRCQWEEPIRRRLREGNARFKNLGAPYLAYAIIDAVIDLYFPVLDSIADNLDTLESLSLRFPGKSEIVRLHHLSGELLALRRVLNPLKDLLSTLIHGEHVLIPKDVQIYFRDCVDHTAGLLDEIDMDHEITRSLVDTTLSAMSNRMNEIMKVLTVISTIFIPLSFMAGLWGMNFDPNISPLNMPELRWVYGYPAALLLMAVVSGSLVLFFFRKGWLGGDRDSRD